MPDRLRTRVAALACVGVAIPAAGIGLATPALAQAADKDAVTPIAFVGSYVSDVPVECNSGEGVDETTGESVLYICMDGVWEFTYDVEKVLEGNLTAGSRIRFTAADHYGYPRFAEEKRALIYLGRNGDRYFHIKYAWDPAYRTVDGDFAACGCDEGAETVAGDRGVQEASTCRAVAFSPPVTRDLVHASRHLVDELRASLDFRIEGETAVCVRGEYVEDVYRRARPDLIAQLEED